VALSVSRFITSDFSGSTTEPVIANRSRRVVTARIAIASGSRARRLAWLSRNNAVSPPTFAG
jgi:hypothetical protein